MDSGSSGNGSQPDCAAHASRRAPGTGSLVGARPSGRRDGARPKASSGRGGIGPAKKNGRCSGFGKAFVENVAVISKLEIQHFWDTGGMHHRGTNTWKKNKLNGLDISVSHFWPTPRPKLSKTTVGAGGLVSRMQPHICLLDPKLSPDCNPNNNSINNLRIILLHPRAVPVYEAAILAFQHFCLV